MEIPLKKMVNFILNSPSNYAYYMLCHWYGSLVLSPRVGEVGLHLLAAARLELGCTFSATPVAAMWEVRLPTLCSVTESLVFMFPSMVMTSCRLGSGSSSVLNTPVSEVGSSAGGWAHL